MRTHTVRQKSCLRMAPLAVHRSRNGPPRGRIRNRRGTHPSLRPGADPTPQRTEWSSTQIHAGSDEFALVLPQRLPQCAVESQMLRSVQRITRDRAHATPCRLCIEAGRPSAHPRMRARVSASGSANIAQYSSNDLPHGTILSRVNIRRSGRLLCHIAVPDAKLRHSTN